MTRASGSLGFSSRAAARWARRQGLPGLSAPLARPRRIMLRGDSTGIGYMTAYPSGNAAAQRCGPSRRMRDALIAAGCYAQDEFVAGSGGYTSASGFMSFDPRISMTGSGWGYWAVTTAVFGTIRNNTDTTSIWTFAPDTQCDSCIFTYARNNSRSTGEISFGGVTKAFNQYNATAGFGSVTIGPADGVALGAHKADIRRTAASGNVSIDSIWCYNSRLPGFQILNGSASGMKAQNLANSTAASASLYYPEQILAAGDECWWQIGVNDWKSSAPTDLAVFQGYVQAWVDQCQSRGIVPRIILPIRSALTDTTVELMQAYDAAQIAVAQAKNVAVYSFGDRWGSYVEASARGMMADAGDAFHANWFGAQDQGQFYAQIALSA